MFSVCVCPVSMSKEKMSSSKERAFPFVTHLRLSRCVHACVRVCVCFLGDNKRRILILWLNRTKLGSGPHNKALKGNAAQFLSV